MTTFRKFLTGSSMLLVLASPVLVNCGAMNSLKDKAGSAAGLPTASCPNELTFDAIMAYDMAGNFKLDAETAGKAKAGIAAAIELKGAADAIDADLKAGCGGLAKDLGAGGDFKDGTAACEAAIKAIGAAKAKIGANAKFNLVVKPPVCRADMNVMADCAGKCDAKVSGGSAKVECEPGKLSGSCDAKCEGSCDMSAAAKCEGECQGECDAEVKGSCSGTCNGKCDGKASKGASCAGTCEGKCEGGKVKGECKGKCGGSCKLSGSASCSGTCNGKCSAEMKAPKCNGEVKPPQMSADCKASCDAKVQGKMDCTPAQVGMAITGGADAKAAADFKAAIEKNFPLILKVALGLGDRAAKLAGSAKSTLEGTLAVSTKITSSGGATGAALAGQFTACFAAPLKGAIDATASLQANVDVSVKVNASASASGSAGGGTK